MAISPVLEASLLQVLGEFETVLETIEDRLEQHGVPPGGGMHCPGGQPCFVAGTLIATPDGDRLVESLRAGDLVSLARGGSAELVWVGHRRVSPASAADPEAARPVRIAAGSFGDGLPRRDLLVSPEHALFVDDVLVPAASLVDGVAIASVDVERVTYHHLELTRHDVILAEGLAAESYLDTGNRALFANAAITSLVPDLAAGDAEGAMPCAELVVSGPRLEAIRARLACLRPEAGRAAA